MNKKFAALSMMMLAWAAVAEPVAYVSIVRDHNGKVTEKAVGTLGTKVDNPAFRVAAVGCLFAQLQAICRESPSEPHRVAAALVLLNHKRMRIGEIATLPTEPGKDALTLLWLHAPKSPAFRQMLERRQL